jgi:hypothetical protein
MGVDTKARTIRQGDDVMSNDSKKSIIMGQTALMPIFFFISSPVKR